MAMQQCSAHDAASSLKIYRSIFNNKRTSRPALYEHPTEIEIEIEGSTNSLSYAPFRRKVGVKSGPTKGQKLLISTNTKIGPTPICISMLIGSRPFVYF